MPRLAIAVVLLALVALASTMSYIGYLVISVIAGYLDIGRFLTGLLLGALFARLPSFREGKLRTIGLLPKPARLPVMAALLAISLLNFAYQGEWVPVMFLGFGLVFLMGYPRLRDRMISRVKSTLFSPPAGSQHRPAANDDGVIDVEFREKKD